ncbi:MAG TPA: hypothetical protein VMS65_07330, partial [Polyangiaceae bacterium]|nr:hypothetical protein [Polyangiaceae bacterium]
ANASGGSAGTDTSGGTSGTAGTQQTGGAASGGAPSGGNGGTVSQGGSGGDGAASSGGSGGMVPETLCGEYCATVIANCDPTDTTKPRLPQYNDMDQCLAVCELLPPGEPNDRNVNTVECRLRLARQAEYEPLNVCPQAGIAGVGACGSSCEAYCSLMNQVCTETTTEGLSGHYYFDNPEDCMAACAEVPDMPPFSVDDDLFGGNHLQCRLYHLLVSTLDGIEHCEHAIGYSICADN